MVRGGSTWWPRLAAARERCLPCRARQSSSWSAPQWARDGTRLFVAAQRRQSNVIIALSSPPWRSPALRFPNTRRRDFWDISIRPDGSRFAYLEAGGGGPELSRLWTVDASGNQAIPLTDGLTAVWSPSWSNDGRQIFYASNRGGSMDLWQQAVADAGTPIGDPIAVTHRPRPSLRGVFSGRNEAGVLAGRQGLQPSGAFPFSRTDPRPGPMRCR